MLKTEIARGPGGRILLLDSITKTAPEDAGAIAVAGSHGGTSSAEFALVVPLRLVAFNDAGVGKDRAGIVALDILQSRGVAAATVSHATARIGDAADMWENGVLSHVNTLASSLGLAPGQALQSSLRRLIARR